MQRTTDPPEFHDSYWGSAQSFKMAMSRSWSYAFPNVYGLVPPGDFGLPLTKPSAASPPACPTCLLCQESHVGFFSGLDPHGLGICCYPPSHQPLIWASPFSHVSWGSWTLSSSVPLCVMLDPQWKHSSLPSIFPGLSQLKTPPPGSLPVFLVWWAGDACSWAPTAAFGNGAFHPGCCLHSVLFMSQLGLLNSPPGPRPRRVPYCQMVILKSAYFQPSCQLWGGNTSRTRGDKRPCFRRWAMGASRISVDCRRGRGWGIDFGPTAWANMGWQLWTQWAHQPG